MNELWIDVCGSDTLCDGGDGVRFELPARSGDNIAAFAVRSGGQVRAFVNRCAHIAVELDWMPGRFFDDEGRYLVCATHGATYRPEDGLCIGGPCQGRSLVRIECKERAGRICVLAHSERIE